MKVRELIERLQQFPSEAEVYFTDGPWQDCTQAEEMEPDPTFENDSRAIYPHGRVRL